MEENNENKNVETKGTENVQEKKKKSGIGLTIVLVILIIALAGGIGYLTKMFLDGKIENGANNNVTNESKIEGKKIDESKPWVYDGDVEEKEIDNGNYNSKDFIKYPVININSNDAKKVNDEIEKIYKETLSKFGSKDQNMEIFTGMDYDYFENENILSVVINTGETVINGNGTGTGIYVYNISLDTLNLVSNDELCKIAGFDSEKQAADKINQWEGRQKARSDGQPTFEGVEKGVYYLDKGNKLNFIYKTVAGGRGYQSAVVDKDNDIKAIFDEKDSENKKITDEKTTSQQDYSVFNSYKGRLYKNEDFNTTSDGEKEYCELQFDDSGKPTLKMGYKSDYNTEFYFQTNEIYNFKTEGAAGATYASFDFSARTPGEDITGNAVISFSNVAEDYILRIDVTANYITGKKEYKNIEVNPIGQSYCESFEVDMLKNRVYESEKKEKDFWYKIEFDGNGKPTIIVGYYANEISQVDATYKRFTDVTCDNAAGSGYIIFSYRLLNETGDKVEGRLHYSNNTDNNEIYLKMYNMDEEIKLKRIK